jgi:dolichol-phosphate mannosyltransferase
MNKTLVFTATYNEVDNVEVLVKRIAKYSKNTDILIIDDNSPDGTKKIIFRLQKRLKRLNVIIRRRKLGLDTAHKFAYNFAIKKGYTNLITMDADLSHDPIKINKMIKILKNNEFVIGSRYMAGGKCEMSFIRTLLSFFGNKFIKLFLNINCNEFTSAYRGFNLKKLKKFDLSKIRAHGYSFFMETVVCLERSGFTIKELPIYFKNRIHGKSKIPKIEIFRTLKNIILLYFKD